MISYLPDKKLKIPNITTDESEIDSLVVEEIFSSSAFQRWLLQKIGREGSHKFIEVWKHFPGQYGECDIVADFEITKQRIVILVENKIYSPEQPAQVRYHKTGRYLVEHENYNQYVTCLLSPKLYFREDAPMKKYDHKISYEELLEWFKKQPNSERMQFKQMVIENGIGRAKTGYVKTIDENTNRFYHYYEKLARRIQPELNYHIPKGKPASGNSSIHFNPEVLPPNVEIIHKGRHGCVDLQISGIDYEKFSKLYKNKFRDKMYPTKLKKQIAVRINVPKLTADMITNITPKKHRKEIVEALDVAGKLLNWYLEFYQK